MRRFTLARHHTSLAELVRRQTRIAAARTAGRAEPAPHLSEVTGFGSNPGGLRMLRFVPPDLPAGAPLVVLLHGCTQTAAGLDHGTGWSDLARRHRFALLLPEQRRANNPNLCFNWFEPADTTRDAGEALSIRQMIARMIRDHRLDPRRVHVAGLSAGGAMAAVMLATYPELFAAGAIIAGLPYGAATTMREAFEAMATGRPRPAPAWGDLVCAASPHRGPWPRLSIWQGEADTTVRPVNAEQILRQWTDLHGLAAPPRLETIRPGHRRYSWRDAEGRVLVEMHSIAGLAHGVPIHPGEGEGRGGNAGPFILDAGISSTHAIAGFFGLLSQRPERPADATAVPDIGGAIRWALRMAGLLRS